VFTSLITFQEYILQKDICLGMATFKAGNTIGRLFALFMFVSIFLVRAGMIGGSGSDTLQSPLRLSPKAVYAMHSTMLPCPSVMVSIEPRLS
jgi:hypothetical protein